MAVASLRWEAFALVASSRPLRLRERRSMSTEVEVAEPKVAVVEPFVAAVAEEDKPFSAAVQEPSGQYARNIFLSASVSAFALASHKAASDLSVVCARRPIYPRLPYDV